MTNPNNPDAMNNILRGRGRPAGTGGQATPDADPIDQAKELTREIASELDTLTKLLSKASDGGANPFAQKEG